MSDLLLRDVEVEGHRVDVRIRDGVVAEIGTDLVARGAEAVRGRGGALLPGLADHHLHLLATAAADLSVAATGLSADGLAARIAAASPGAVRVVGWHESEPLGELTAQRLERIAPGRDVRVQHRGGALWVLSPAALDQVAPLDHPGVERDPAGAPTGRLLNADRWLGERLGTDLPDLRPLAGRLAEYGLTHLTDATPALASAAVDALTAAFPQHLRLLGDPAGDAPWKVLLPEDNLPDLAALTDAVARAHAAGRAVAVHSVTRTSLLLALAAIDDARARPGDRIEHAAVTPPEARAEIRRLGLTVVTQPGIATSRGDAHRLGVDPDDQPWLWPLRSLLDAGVAVGLSSDAPHGPLDPWEVMRAARDRLTPTGADANRDERIDAATALRMLTTSLDDPGGPPRRVVVGAPADLVLCHAGLAEVLSVLEAGVVRLVLRAGRRIAGE